MREKRVAEEITRLLSHYWTADDHPALQQALLDDWLEDLAEFSPAHVRVACREWRQNNKWRPKISEIRALALAEQHRAHKARRDLLPAPPMSREQIEEQCAGLYGSCGMRYERAHYMCGEWCRDRVSEHLRSSSTPLPTKQPEITAAAKRKVWLLELSAWAASQYDRDENLANAVWEVTARALESWDAISEEDRALLDRVDRERVGLT
jgi:hypothetical protein